MNYDLRNASFEEFLDFLFDHPVTERYRKESPVVSEKLTDRRWYDRIGFPGEPKVLHTAEWTADHYTVLFERPEILLDRYSRDQIAQGFDLVAGCLTASFDAGLGRLLVDRSIELERRLRLAEALYPLHDRLFVGNDLTSVAGGLWFGLGIAIGVHGKPESEYGEDTTDLAQIKGALFTVLCRLLDHKEVRFVDAAMLGMKGIEHWKTPVALRACLNSRDDLGEETRNHALFLIDCFDKLYIKRPVYH